MKGGNKYAMALWNILEKISNALVHQLHEIQKLVLTR